MQTHKTKNIFVSLLLLAVGVVYAQNPSTQLYIADGATFFVSENTTIHIVNGWIEYENAKTSVVETVINSNTQKQTHENSLKRLKKALESNKTPLVKQEKNEDKKSNTINQVATLPFGNFPIGTTNTILTRLAVAPSTTVNHNHKKISLKKSQNKNSFLSPTTIGNQQIAICNLQSTIYKLQLAICRHTTRPPPSV